MAKRLVRARTKIRQTAISFELPGPEGLAERLSSVQAVLYLVFTEGHLASGDGPAVRAELCDEAIWLARQLHRLLPGDAETTGLLALMLLQHSRADARHDEAGHLVTFAEQDRARWDADGDRRGPGAAGDHRPRARSGPYQVQAAIAALHAAATSADDVNWPRIADLYGLLDRLAPSPVVTVNRAVAVGRADGPRAALALLAPVLADGRLDGYAPLHAAHADLLERAGDAEGAIAAWRRAAEAARNPPSRRRSPDGRRCHSVRSCSPPSSPRPPRRTRSPCWRSATAPSRRRRTAGRRCRSRPSRSTTTTCSACRASACRRSGCR